MTTTMKLDAQELRLQHARELKEASDAALAKSERCIRSIAVLDTLSGDYPGTKLALLRDAQEHTAQARALWQEAMDILAALALSR